MVAGDDKQAASTSKTGGYKDLLQKWKAADQSVNPSPSKGGYTDVLNKWKAAEQSVNSTPFKNKAMVPNGQKSLIAVQNQTAIKNYRQKFVKRDPSKRGVNGGGKPTQLKDVFRDKLENLEDYTPPVFGKSEAEVELIKNALEKNFFFDGMSSAELNTFIQAFEPIEISKGMDVIYQGEVGDYFYVISEGVVSFEVNGNIVGTAGAGDSFGELALLYTCPRAATVYAASEPTSFFRVDQRTFRSMLQKQTKKSETLKLELLRSVDFLKELDESDIKRLADALTPRTFQEEDVLVRKGEEGDAFYILQEGEMKVSDISVGNSNFDDVILKPGDYFGERALATNEPRAANVTALTEGVAFSIHRTTFEKVLGKFSRLIIKAQDRRLLEGMDFFKEAHLAPHQIENLANHVNDETFRPGRNVMFQNLKNTEAALYIVHEGCAQLSGKRNEIVKPGDYFGEELLLLDAQSPGTPNTTTTPSTTMAKYTATAMGECTVGVLTLTDCRQIFDTRTLLVGSSGMEGLLNSPSMLAGTEDMDDEELMAMPAMAPPRTLGRGTTQRWLKESSAIALRDSVHTEVALQDLERQSVLGDGQFGEVWLVTADLDENLGGRNHFALKIQKKKDPTRGDSVEAFQREIDVLALMDHPFIINLVHHYQDEDNLYLLMGLVHGGELFDVIHHQDADDIWTSGIPEDDAKFYAMVVADTLDYMHRKDVIFRDLKPENILIDKDGYPVLCDFGFAKYVTSKTFTLCGTPNYLSPEVIMDRGHSFSTDHWSLGVVIYEMICGENPFYYDGMDQMSMFKAICQDKFYPLPDDISDEAYDVIEPLLEKDPALRLGALAGRGKDIMKMGWFDGLDLWALRRKSIKAPFIPTNMKLDSLLEESS